MYHWHHATVQHTPQNETVCHRNIHLLFWKNITHPVLIAKHIVRLALLVAWRAVPGNWSYLRGMWAAFHQLPQALKRRQPMMPLWARTDAEVWALIRDAGPSASPSQAGGRARREPATAGLLSR